ncbi:MAG TPA: YdcF family protein [Oscillatoriaceae cyanobacterium M33_DOE_052]|uniref:YdcF family protein n=1 Tax=Planktothricoides sp. SpSt-374 TaxID=2282167 RepID=A0A7C3VMM6_9CYAN|nr:YdcF family protein [Oscillatoriaceae cyanobacterium M33_DOE_052]
MNKKAYFSNKSNWWPPQKTWHIFRRNWCFLLLFIMVAAMGLITVNLHNFLAISQPVKEAEILVVEGWLPDYAIKEAIGEFNSGKYQLVITTGLPLSKGYYLAEYKNFAQLAAATMVKLGFDPNKLVAVPGPEVMKDRTYASAIALREWLQGAKNPVKAINLYTFGPHARRSWLLFKKALAPEITVGVIAVAPQDYDPQYWWRTSEGVRTVIGETIAYVYARLSLGGLPKP